MQLDLTRYRQPTSHFARTFRAEEVADAGDDYQIVEPVQVDLEIHKDHARVRMVGTVRTTLEVTCSRCLEPFRVPFDGSFDLRYAPATELGADGDNELAEDDLDTSVYRDDQIDLSEMLREQFYLALPMKPLCRDECRGLCPSCGTNRNTGACTCAPAWEDPRLAPLKELKP